MATIKPNSYVLNVDIKQRMSNKTPRFVQFDEAQIVFKIYDGGKPFDLSGFTSAVVTHKTRSNQVISGYGTFEDLNGQRVVVYDYMGSEMKELGNVETSLSIYNDENDKVSVMPFNVQIVRDLSHEYSEKDTSVLQDLIAKTTDAISKIEYAEDQGDYAKEQGTFAETQGNHAKTQGDYAQTQGTRAETLGNKAETQVGQAQDILDVAVPAYERVEEVYSNTVNLENQHAYDATKQYHKNNIVEFNGSSYQALQDTKGNQPPVNASNEYWSLLARKGADGTGTVVRHREEFISTEGQTTFTLKNTYDQFQNRIDVTVGNVPQFSPDNFTEATNTSIKLNEPLPAGIQVVVTYFSEAQPLKNDIQTVVNNHTTNLSAINQEIEDIKVIRHREEFVTTEGQDTFTLKNEYDMNQNRVDVVAGGVPQYSPEHFIEFTNKSIKFTEPFPAGELVIVTYFGKATPLLYDVDTVLDNHSVRLNTSEAELTSISQQLADTVVIGSGENNDIWNPPTQPEINSYFVDGDFEKRHIYHEWIGLFDSIQADNSSYVTKQVLGKIYEDRYDFPVYTFAPENGYSKTLIIGAGMHGGEKQSVISLFKFLKHLCEDWRTSPQLAYVRNNVRLIVMPLQNPFGIAYNTRTNGNGVDINRNFNYKWNEYTPVYNEPFGADYKGETVESETETQYIKQVLTTYKGAIAYIDFHNMSPVTAGGGFSSVSYIPEKQPFNRDLIVSLMERLNPEGKDYRNGTTDNPSAFNYAANVFGMHSFNPEYTPGNSGTPYGEQDMTMALRWYANIIFIFSSLKNKASVESKNNPFIRSSSVNRSTATAYPISVGNYAEVSQLRGTFKPSSRGVAKLNYELTYSCDDPNAQVFFCPVIYQSESVDLQQYKNLFEVYERGNGNRRTITVYAVINVDDFKEKGTVTYGLYAYTSSGVASILRFRNILEVTPNATFESSVFGAV